jgi:CheY-like chemotaxis protein
MSEKCSILIVDDEAIVRMSLHEYLEDCEYVVSSFECAEDALALLQSGHTFDLVIADLRMPRMNGEEFILRAASICPTMKYILQTGSLGYTLSSELQAAGLRAENVLKKPVIRLDIFEHLIEKLLQK